MRADLGFAEEDFNVVCVATVQHRKGQDLLVDSFGGLLREIPNLRLLCVGNVVGRADWAAALMKRAEEPAFGGRLRFLGGRWDAKALMYAADAVVLPSRAEAMLVSVLEAMALGTPVVASAVDGVPELIVDGKTGRLFSLDQPEDMVAALGDLSRSPDDRHRLGLAGKARYWSQFSQRHFVERYHRMAEDLLATHRGAVPAVVA